MNYTIGIDFDNTLISYHDVFYDVAVQVGLINTDVIRSKREIRDWVRRSPDGELAWQWLQAIVYGPKIGDAQLVDGVTEFLRLCRKHSVATYIISHKTEYATADETDTNLREAALNWMDLKGFFNSDGLGLQKAHVYFETTRLAKIDRIRSLGCTHFIDDLEETFLEDSFPEYVEKILYAPYSETFEPNRVKSIKSWTEIIHYFFGMRE